MLRAKDGGSGSDFNGGSSLLIGGNRTSFWLDPPVDGSSDEESISNVEVNASTRKIERRDKDDYVGGKQFIFTTMGTSKNSSY